MSNKWSKFIKSFIDNKGYLDVLDGLFNTFKIAVLGFIIGLIIGLIVSSVKLAGEKNKVAKGFSRVGDVYVAFFRGTPIVVQLLLIYYVLFPLMGISVDRIVVAVMTFGLNSGAYVSEIMRGGILSVDKGQMEAGRSLGLSYSGTMIRVVIPQAFKNMFPTLGNELIALIKDTSVVGFIAVVDLTQAFQFIGSSNYEYIVPYLILALTYILIVLVITIIIKILERRLRASDKR